MLQNKATAVSNAQTRENSRFQLARSVLVAASWQRHLFAAREHENKMVEVANLFVRQVGGDHSSLIA